MGMINNTLNHLRAYAFGESCTDITVNGKHAFDLIDKDVRVLLKELEVLQLLSVMPDADEVQTYNNFAALRAIAKEVDKDI